MRSRTRSHPRGRSTALALAVAGCLAAALPAAGASLAEAATSATAAPAAAGDGTATVFYYTKTRNWAAYNLHWAPDGGSWTTVPGTGMEAACTDWVKKTVSLGSAAGLQATFNNGQGTWDNNGGKNYALGTGVITVKDGVVAHSDPCVTDPGTGTGTGASATVYYATTTVGWPTVNLHWA